MGEIRPRRSRRSMGIHESRRSVHRKDPDRRRDLYTIRGDEEVSEFAGGVSYRGPELAWGFHRQTRPQEANKGESDVLSYVWLAGPNRPNLSARRQQQNSKK